MSKLFFKQRETRGKELCTPFGSCCCCFRFGAVSSFEETEIEAVNDDEASRAFSRKLLKVKENKCVCNNLNVAEHSSKTDKCQCNGES